MKVEYVHWRDACYNTEEARHDELGGLADLHEIGFLVKETDESVVLAIEHMDGAVSSRLTLTIPKVNIVQRVPINLQRILSKRKPKDK